MIGNISYIPLLSQKSGHPLPFSTHSPPTSITRLILASSYLTIPSPFYSILSFHLVPLILSWNPYPFSLRLLQSPPNWSVSRLAGPCTHLPRRWQPGSDFPGRTLFGFCNQSIIEHFHWIFVSEKFTNFLISKGWVPTEWLLLLVLGEAMWLFTKLCDFILVLFHPGNNCL